MSSFMICAKHFAGHIGPALPVVRELAARGHDVRFYTGAKYRERIMAAGARFVGHTQARNHDDSDLDATFPEHAKLKGLAQFHVRDLGLRPDGRWLFNVPLSPHLFPQPSVPSLEYPRRQWPPRPHFIGALLPSSSGAELPPWWDELDAAERVVLVTQGTVQVDPEQLIVPTIQAFADAPATLVVATLPSHRSGQLSLRPLPGKARVASFVPFDALMPHVDALVTNGGFGGVHFALSAGVPLVVAGATEEKLEVARRVEYAGVGVNLATGRPTPRQIRSGVERVWADPDYRRAAAKVRAELRAADGPTQAADPLPRLAETGKAVARDPTAPLPRRTPRRGPA